MTVKATNAAIAGTSWRRIMVIRRSPTRSRSEERRVGKECRSLCDWSSDVCSSDLERVGKSGDDSEGHKRSDRWDELAANHGHQTIPNPLEIGRASCRERV